MKSVKSTDVSEETRYVVDCPYCGDITDIDEPSDDEAQCEHCEEVFEIEE